MPNAPSNFVSRMEAGCVRSRERAAGALATVDQDTRHTISTAVQAFGGHISRGLLRRGKGALARRSAASERLGRKEIFLRLSRLPNLRGFRGVNETTWQEVNALLDQCRLYCDLGDKHDYAGAARGALCAPKWEALTCFVTRYGNARERKLIAEKLETPPHIRELQRAAAERAAHPEEFRLF